MKTLKWGSQGSSPRWLLANGLFRLLMGIRAWHVGLLGPSQKKNGTGRIIGT